MRSTDWITLSASMGALLFSLLNYLRSARFENSNHLYKLKVELYTQILTRLSSLADNIANSIVQAELLLKKPKDDIEEKFEQLADQIDNIIFDFDHFLLSNSLVIPKRVLSKLEVFNKFLINSELTPEIHELSNNSMAVLNSVYEDILQKANEINELIRKNIYVDKLNESLYKRLK